MKIEHGLGWEDRSCSRGRCIASPEECANWEDEKHAQCEEEALYISAVEVKFCA